MQQREQRILQKLAEAREAQANAMSRIIQARARLMQVETRLQALHTHLAPALRVAEQPLASTPLAEVANNPALSEPDGAAKRMVIPPVNTPPISAKTTDPFISASSLIDMQTPLLAEQTRPPDAKSSPTTEQSSLKPAAPMPAMDEQTAMLLDEDEEETQKMPSLRLVRSISAAQQNSGAEEKQLTARSTPPPSEQTAQNAGDRKTREAGASDVPAKTPVTRQEHEQTREPL